MENITIDFNGNKTIGDQLGSAIIDKIKSREWPPGYRLPSMRQMQTITGISICLIRKVINELSGLGYINLYQGKGIFVATPWEGPKSIVLVLPDIGPEHIIKIFRGVKQALSNSGANLLIQAATNDYHEESDLINKLDKTFVAGAIIYPPPLKSFIPTMKELQRRNFSYVLVNHELKNSKADSITVDYRAAGAMAMSQLLNAGHRKIAILGIDSYESSFQMLYDGVKEVLADKGIKWEDIVKIFDDPLALESPPWERARKLIINELPKHPEITGILAIHENMTLGCYLALREMQLAIPEDISLQGMGELSAFEVIDPRICTVTQPYEEIGRQAAYRLMNILKTPPAETIQIHLQPELRPGKSIHPIATHKFS